MSIIHNKDIKSPKLQAVIVEPILIGCIKKITLPEILFDIQRILPLSDTVIKKYLFYLIDYELISYDGQKQMYILEEGGFSLLDMIEREKRQEITNINDITITFECT